MNCVGAILGLVLIGVYCNGCVNSLVPLFGRNSLDDLRILFYSPITNTTTTNSATSYRLTDSFGAQFTADPSYRNDRPTVLYLHGYLESPIVKNVLKILTAYEQRNDHNVLLLDWSTLAAGSYLLSAVPNSRRVADLVADTLLSAFSSGLRIEDFHIVGHSLGGQMAGFIGRRVQSESNGSRVIRRISALDPANPPFYIDFTHLRARDALFVDVIHSDSGRYGAPVATGTVDYWPNSGRTLQPGCPTRTFLIPLSEDELCSHQRAVGFWADSLLAEHSFLAVKANSWSNFRRGRVDAEVSYMGIASSGSAIGSYYLQTNDNSPFGRSEAGLHFE